MVKAKITFSRLTISSDIRQIFRPIQWFHSKLLHEVHKEYLLDIPLGYVVTFNIVLTHVFEWCAEQEPVSNAQVEAPWLFAQILTYD